MKKQLSRPAIFALSALLLLLTALGAGLLLQKRRQKF